MTQVIYIVGQINLQNQLLKFFLHQELGIECRCGCDLGNVSPNAEGGAPDLSLVLWDCISNSIQLLQRELESEFLSLHADCCFALYNFSRASAVPPSLLEKGVRGVFFENDPLEKIAGGIQKIVDGELWLPRKMMTRFILEKPKREALENRRPPLTAREKQILGLLAAGRSNQEMADSLCISPHTVKTHVYNIFQKIGVSNRLQAALWAGKHLSSAPLS